mmetsp:Transcript_135001/g.248312  ORF Transcript_135001/g.248312 Transcript_135001/m.248312 type:complete len:565 (-) Transcript_135001:35-1729(-)
MQKIILVVWLGFAGSRRHLKAFRLPGSSCTENGRCTERIDSSSGNSLPRKALTSILLGFNQAGALNPCSSRPLRSLGGYSGKRPRQVCMQSSEGTQIAIVGTGMAALMCTRSLARLVRGDVECPPGLRNARITLCTSRGKLATQMGPKNQAIPKPGKPFFDYGCQYFTVTDPWLLEDVEHWHGLGYLSVLEDGQVGMLSETDGFSPVTGEKCWVGNGGMGPFLTNIIDDTVKEFSGIVKHVPGFPNSKMAVKKLTKTPEGWQLGTKGGNKIGPFDFVIGGFAQHLLTDPLLLSGGQACQKMLQCLRRVESNQIIPIQVSFEGDPLPAKFTTAHVYGEDCLSLISNNCKKPQQSGEMGTPGPQHWTLMSTAEFAEREFNTNTNGYRRIAEERMFEAMSRLLGVPDIYKHKPNINRINHWEDGLAAKTPPNSQGCLFDADVGLGWCGDFCTLPGVQGAALSGKAMATTLSKFIENSEDFDPEGLLPADEEWIPFQPQGATMVDIGSFSDKLGLKPSWTHTDLVPSAINGYDPETKKGAAGRALKNKGGSKGRGGGKSKRSSAGRGR